MTPAHTKEEFAIFMSQLKETNATLAFFSDFKKIAKNVDDIAISLNMLNYLLGKEDLRSAVEALWNRDKQVFDVMDILIATRKKEIKKFFDEKGSFRLVHSLFQSIDGVMEFLEGTGLADVFRNSKIKDLEDYVFGVETGLDTHARKNRSGNATENIVANIFTNAGIEFQQQVPSCNFTKVADALGTDMKVFDFAVQTPRSTYLVEVNFYSGGGSKLNEVARSYTELGQKVNSIDGYEFVWITDGIGWNAARNKLEEAYYAIPNTFNLTNLKDFVATIQKETLGL